MGCDLLQVETQSSYGAERLKIVAAQHEYPDEGN